VKARLTTIVVAATVLALATGFVVQHRRAGTRLAAHRADLAATRSALAETRTDLARVSDVRSMSETAAVAFRSEISAATEARTMMDSATENTLTEIAGVRASLNEADTGRYLVAANANQTNTCLLGVSRAVSANRSGDQGGAVLALNASAEACNRTLAYATGAVFPYDFPDPFVLRAGNTYYGYSTNSGAGDIQVIRATDRVSWQLVGNALSHLPVWARAGTTWAPAVLARNGTYVVYYTVRQALTDRQCITRAVSRSPTGPFVDDTWGPIVCDQFGSIDPSPFVDSDGRAYLLWKSEGAPNKLWSRELTADGLGLTGPARLLVAADRAFERGVVEAPALLREGGSYYLLYSAAKWDSTSYSIAFATCAGPAGPCAKPAGNQILVSGARLAGPGGAEAFRDGGDGIHVTFHAYAQPNVGYPSSRYFHVAPLRIVGNRPVIDATT
jgi:Glycosyl hydrolases family 43